MRWQNLQSIKSKQYTCGYCGNLVASIFGYPSLDDLNIHLPEKIHICPHCSQPTFFNAISQIPGISPGAEIKFLPNDVEQLYAEARKSVSIGAPTASILASRKLLMNIAVSQGANEGLKFIEYVDYLATKGFLPPNGREWVDHIRSKGNEATHEIKLMSTADAEELISFTEMLLKIIFEFPNKVPKKQEEQKKS